MAEKKKTSLQYSLQAYNLFL